MKKSRFTESQIVAILKEGEAGVAVAQLTRKHGISAATYYHWKSKYGGAAVSELKRLRELEAENAKLKRMYAVWRWRTRRSRTFSAENIWSAPDLQEPCSDERDSLRKYIRPLASQGRLVPRP
jgi:putative transposase